MVPRTKEQLIIQCPSLGLAFCYGRAAHSSQLWASVSSTDRLDKEPSCGMSLRMASAQTDTQHCGFRPGPGLPLQTGDVAALWIYKPSGNFLAQIPYKLLFDTGRQAMSPSPLQLGTPAGPAVFCGSHSAGSVYLPLGCPGASWCIQG